mgnify:CR=1 FL=1
MKQANHVFEKVTKYAIRKLSVGVGPVAIGTFLLAGGLFVPKPVSADQVTTDASVHMAYVTENELTAEEQKQVIHAIPKEYQNEELFIWFINVRETVKLLFLRQEALTGQRQVWDWQQRLWLCCYFQKNIVKKLLAWS